MTDLVTVQMPRALVRAMLDLNQHTLSTGRPVDAAEDQRHALAAFVQEISDDWGGRLPRHAGPAAARGGQPGGQRVSHADFDDLGDAARFCAELVRQSIAFNMRAQGSGWRVNMTGF